MGTIGNIGHMLRSIVCTTQDVLNITYTLLLVVLGEYNETRAVVNHCRMLEILS